VKTFTTCGGDDVNAVVSGYLRDLAYAQSTKPRMFGYKRAAAAIFHLERSLVDLVREHGGELPRIPGIGPSSARIIREVLEGLASRLAAVNMDRATLMELKALFAVPEVRKMRKDPSVLASADQRFHAAIVGCTRNGRLRDLMAKLNDQMQMVRMRTITLPGRLDASIREHQDLVSALTAGDPRVAEERARRHIRNVRRAVLEHYRDPQSTEEKRL